MCWMAEQIYQKITADKQKIEKDETDLLSLLGLPDTVHDYHYNFQVAQPLPNFIFLKQLTQLGFAVVILSGVDPCLNLISTTRLLLT